MQVIITVAQDDLVPGSQSMKKTVAGALVTGQIVDGTAVLEATFRGRHLRGLASCKHSSYILETPSRLDYSSVDVLA